MGNSNPARKSLCRIDQTLTQDATGTLVMLELEAMGLDRVQTEVSAQYVDHNLIQEDFKNPDDHLFLESACRRYGIWYSRPGNGVSHPVHQERFGRPGKTLSRIRQPHPRRRGFGHVGHRSGRLGSGAGDGGNAVLRQNAPRVGRAVDGRIARLGQRKRRGSGNAPPARCEGRKWVTSSSISDRD